MRCDFAVSKLLSVAALVVAVSALASLPLSAQDESAEQQQHDMSDMDMSDDDMSPEMIEEMRKVVPVLREQTDEEILASRSAMPDVDVYLSDVALEGDTGVLVLGHGYREHGNAQFEGGLAPIAAEYPTAIGYGMAMHMSSHIQAAVDKLVAAGAKRILVLPFTSIADGKMTRQWKYILGLSEEPGWMAVPKVTTPATIAWAELPTDDPVLSTILGDYARELSADPASEVAILLSHGPTDPAANETELEVMGEHAARVKEAAGFADVIAFSIQDDAPSAVRGANVERLRAIVSEATAAGKHVIVVPFLLNSDQLLHMKLRDRDLDGLDFKIGMKGVVAHPAFAEWVADAIDAQL